MDIKSIIANNPLIKNMVDKKEVVWINPKEINYTEYEKNLPIKDQELKEAEERLKRFAPFIKKVFPETEETNGIIESPLEEIFNMQKELEKKYNTEIPEEFSFAKENYKNKTNKAADESKKIENKTLTEEKKDDENN